MTLLGFLTRRFFFFMAVISVFLASLFVVVELFEKILRVAHTSLFTIFYFSGLNFVPTWFDLLPVSAWLATLLVIRELISRQEWDFLQLLTFIPRSLLKWLCGCGVVCMIVVMVGRETVGVPLAVKAERVRQEKFKQKVQTVLLNQWFELDDATMCYARLIDQQKQTGNDFLLMRMHEQNAMHSMLMASEFTLDAATQTVHIPVGILHDFAGRTDQQVINYDFTSPSLFLQMRMHHQVPTLVQGVVTLVTQHATLPGAVLREVGRRCLVPLGYYASLVLYPLLTLLLFLLISPGIVRWGLALMPYPYFVLTGIAMEGLVASGWPIYFLLLPHLIGVLGLLTAYFWCWQKRTNAD